MNTLSFDISTVAGDAANARITLTELESGDIEFRVEVLDGAIAGLQGLFFNISDESLVNGLFASGSNIAGSEFMANTVSDLGDGVSMNGTNTDFDAGIKIGTSGTGQNAPQAATFILSYTPPDIASPDVSLTLDLFEAQNFGVSLSSTVDNPEGSQLVGVSDQAPGAVSDIVNTEEDTAITADVLENDDQGEVPNTISIAPEDAPANGVATVNPEGSMDYVPNPDFFGEDAFTYTITDADGDTSTAMVTVIVDPNPEALNDAVTTDEDAPITTYLLANDDLAGEPDTTITSLSDPSNGIVVINPDGTVTYTPAQNYSGSDSFTYTITDDDGDNSTSTVTITVNDVNDEPTSTPLEAQTREDGETIAPVDISSNFADVDGTLTYAATGLPVGLNLDPTTGIIAGAIDANASDAEDDNSGSQDYSVTVTATDDDGASTSQLFTWTVNNAAPGAVDDEYSTDEDTTLTIPVETGVLGNDVDGAADSDPLTVTANTDPVNGGVSVNEDGSFAYTPNADFNGVDTFEYTLSDGNGGTAIATVTITVNDVNDEPISTSLEAQINEDGETIAPVDISSSFVDVDSALTYAATDLPLGLSLDPTTGIITGTIDANASDVEDDNSGSQDYSVTVTATDDDGAITSQLFTWTVNNIAPDAVNDEYSTDEDTILTIPVEGGVLGNDVDGVADSDLLTVTANTDPVNGVLTLNEDGSFDYTPNADFNGVDSFEYTLSDGNGGTATATATITVNDVNDDPTSTPLEAQVSEDGETIVPVDVSGSFTDVDGTLTYATTDLPLGLSVDPTTGIITGTIDANASDVEDDNSGSQDYLVTVTATDDDGAITSQLFTWTVNNIAPDAVNDEYSTDEDTTLTIPVETGVLGNDVDSAADSDPLIVTANTDPVNGMLTLNEDGSFDYTPNANFNGVDTFDYTLSDGNGGTATATVTITVNSVNDLPDAVEDAVVTDEDVAVSGNVLDGSNDGIDTDLDGDTLIVTANTEPTNGTVTITPDGNYTYTPALDFNGTDSFEYTISDGNGGTDTATVTITVNPVDDIPSAVLMEEDVVSTPGSGGSADSLTGNSLVGGAEADALIGGLGDQTLISNIGNDSFISTNVNEGKDSITDLLSGSDLIVSDNAVDNGFEGVSDGTTSFLGSASGLVYSADGNQLSYWDDSSNLALATGMKTLNSFNDVVI